MRRMRFQSPCLPTSEKMERSLPMYESTVVYAAGTAMTMDLGFAVPVLVY